MFRKQRYFTLVLSRAPVGSLLNCEGYTQHSPGLPALCTSCGLGHVAVSLGLLIRGWTVLATSPCSHSQAQGRGLRGPPVHPPLRDGKTGS